MSQDRFGLDDFRWVVDDPTPNEAGRPARRPFRNWLWRTIVFALVIGAGFALVTRAVGYAVPFVVPVTVLVALATLRRALGAVEAPRLALVTQPPPVAAAAFAPSEVADGLRVATTRWDNRLSYTDRDAARFARAVQPRLAEIVDERLRLRHGITRAGDPARARQLLGETVWGMVTVPVRKSPTPQQLAAVIAEVEAL